MSRVKTEIDGGCYDCIHYSRTRATTSLDAGACYPEETDCDLDWECPDLDDCTGECEYCTAACDDRKEEFYDDEEVDDN